MATPIVAQWEALEHVLYYLKGSPSRGILYTNHGHIKIECFCDADHGGQRLQGDLLQDAVFLWEKIWSLGKARSRMWFLGPVQKLSIEQ